MGAETGAGSRSMGGISLTSLRLRLRIITGAREGGTTVVWAVGRSVDEETGCGSGKSPERSGVTGARFTDPELTGTARTVVAGPVATGAGELGEVATEVTGAAAGRVVATAADVTGAVTEPGVAGVGIVAAIVGVCSGWVRQKPFGTRETGRSI